MAWMIPLAAAALPYVLESGQDKKTPPAYQPPQGAQVPDRSAEIAALREAVLRGDSGNLRGAGDAIAESIQGQANRQGIGSSSAALGAQALGRANMINNLRQKRAEDLMKLQQMTSQNDVARAQQAGNLYGNQYKSDVARFQSDVDYQDAQNQLLRDMLRAGGSAYGDYTRGNDAAAAKKQQQDNFNRYMRYRESSQGGQLPALNYDPFGLNA